MCKYARNKTCINVNNQESKANVIFTWPMLGKL